MAIRNLKSAAATLPVAFALVVVLSALAAPKFQSAPATAQEVVLVLDPVQSKVHYTVDTTLHSVHGIFALKSGTVHFDPESGKAGGEIIVYASSGDSGNSSRDERMHNEILETPKYPDAVFRPTQVEGKVAHPGTSDVKLHGVIELHGKQHDIVVPVHAELGADKWSGTAKFDVPYVQWGIKNPSNWLLKVKPVVNIELQMSGPTLSN